MTDVNRRIAAMINAIVQAHDQVHEVTGPCVLEMHDGGEVVWKIEVHRDKEGDWGEASITDDEGTPIPIDLASPIFWKFSDSGDLLQLCHGLGLQLIVWDTCKYSVHPWETDENVSVVTITPGDQGPPIYLDHPVADVQTALDIILTERRKSNVLAKLVPGGTIRVQHTTEGFPAPVEPTDNPSDSP